MSDAAVSNQCPPPSSAAAVQPGVCRGDEARDAALQLVALEEEGLRTGSGRGAVGAGRRRRCAIARALGPAVLHDGHGEVRRPRGEPRRRHAGPRSAPHREGLHVAAAGRRAGWGEPTMLLQGGAPEGPKEAGLAGASRGPRAALRLMPLPPQRLMGAAGGRCCRWPLLLRWAVAGCPGGLKGCVGCDKQGNHFAWRTAHGGRSPGIVQVHKQCNALLKRRVTHGRAPEPTHRPGGQQAGDKATMRVATGRWGAPCGGAAARD